LAHEKAFVQLQFCAVTAPAAGSERSVWACVE